MSNTTNALLLTCAGMTLALAPPNDARAQVACTTQLGLQHIAYPSCNSPLFWVVGIGHATNRVFVQAGAQQGEYDLRINVADGDNISILAKVDNLRFDDLNLIPMPNATESAVVTIKLGGDFPIAYIREFAPQSVDNVTPTITLTRYGSDIDYDVVQIDYLGVSQLLSLEVGGDLGAVDAQGDPTEVAVYRRISDVDVLGNVFAQVFVGSEGWSADQIDDFDVKGAIGIEGNALAGLIQTTGRIGTIIAGAIHSSISVGPQNSRAEAGLIETKTDSPYTGDGHFTGSIIADELLHHTQQGDIPGRIRIAGDFGGALTLLEPIQNRSDGDIAPIIIDGSLLETAAINLPEEGLAGYILGGYSGTGDWEEGAVVSVGEIELDDPDYNNVIPATVGGSSVGLAPYDLYEVACEPRHDSVHVLHVSPTCLLEGEPTCIELLECVSAFQGPFRLQFRGPINEVSGPASGLVVIKRRSLVAPLTAWENAEDITSDFSALTVDAGPESPNSVLQLSYTGQTDLGTRVEFQITEGANPPTCYGVFGEPEVLPFTYQCTVYFDCRTGLEDLFDLNEDGVVNYLDLLNWLIQNQDLNYDGGIDVIDFEVLYAAILYYENL